MMMRHYDRGVADKTDARKRLFGRDAKRTSFAMAQPQRAKVSSAALRKVGDRTDSKRRPDSVWQSKAYDYADAIGELGYALALKAHVVATCDLFVQERGGDVNTAAPAPIGVVGEPDTALQEADDGPDKWVNSLDDRALRVMEYFVPPQGGQFELKRRAALHLSTAGETFLLGSIPPDDPMRSIVWEFLSTEEIKLTGTGFERTRDGVTKEPVPKDSYCARLWRSSARFSDRAESEVKRVLAIAQEVLILTQAVDAIASSRLAAGILYVPQEMSFSAEDEEPDEDEEVDQEDDGIDVFTEQLLAHVTAPKNDPSSAASLVPLIMRGPADMADKVKLIDLARNLDTWAQGLRQEALGRLAVGLDIPREVIEGKSSLSYMGMGAANNLDVDLIIKHVVPLGELLADFLTFAYLRPMLEEFEGMDAEEAARFRVAFDPSPVMPRGDEAGAARTLHDKDAVSDDTLRRANGFEESDAPDPDELFERRVWRLILSAPQVYAEALLRYLPGFEGVDIASLGQPAPIFGSAGAAISLDVAPPPPGFELLALQLATSADAAMERAVEQAAARLYTRANKDVTLRDRLRGVDKARALTVFRPQEMETLGVTIDSLFSGAWDRFAARARGWTRAWLEGAGVEPLVADDRAALASSILCSQLHDYCVAHASTGFPSHANGLQVPMTMVTKALEGISPEDVYAGSVSG